MWGLGKRNAEDEKAKAGNAKKQKIERDEAVIAKQKVEKKKPKKVESSSESEDDSSSDDEPRVKFLIFLFWDDNTFKS